MKWEIREPQVLGGVWGKAPIRMDAHSPRNVDCPARPFLLSYPMGGGEKEMDLQKAGELI